jgi:hypothetical protein
MSEDIDVVGGTSHPSFPPAAAGCNRLSGAAWA